MSRRTARIEILEGAHPTLLDRVVLPSGQYLLQSSLESVRLEVIEQGFGEVYATDLEVSDVVFNTLQVDGYWSEQDNEGYNFRYTLDSSMAPMFANKSYRVVVTFRTTSFGPHYSQWELKVRDVPGVEVW